LKEEKKITSRSLALVLVHDLLLAGGIQAGDGPVKQALLRHKTRLRGEWQRRKIKRGAKTDGEMALADDVRAGRLAVLFSFVLDGDENFSAKLDRIPRYARINALKWTVDEAIMAFQKSGYVLGNPLDGMYVVHPYRLKLPTRALFPSVTPPPVLLRNFARDAHIENLLLFHPQSELTDTSEYSDGRLILQDKASCFPAVVLAPPAHPKSVIIDATAAPGNKTSHMSALMENKGKVQAPHLHCTNIEPSNSPLPAFLIVDPCLRA